MTKDELFLLKLHLMAQASGEEDTPIDRYQIGRAVGLNDKGIDNVVRLLAQANFVKKGEGDAIYLTPQGLRLIESLKQSKK